MSKPPPTAKPYKPIGAKPAPDTALMQDPKFLAFHQGRVAASGGEMPDQNSPALARKVKYPGGPLAGMTRAGAAGASLAAWNAQGGASLPATATPAGAAPSPDAAMDSWKAGNQPTLLQPSVITPQSINGATSRGGGVASFPSGTVVEQPGGAKQMSSQYGSGSSVQVPGGVRDFSKAHVFDNGKPVLTSAARAAGVTGYDAQGNAIRATAPAPTAPAPAAPATPAPAPQAARQVIVPKATAPAAAPAPTNWVDQQVAEIKKGTKVYDPNSAADRAAFAPRSTSAKQVITPYRAGAAAVNGLGMGIVKGVGQGINELFKVRNTAVRQ